MTLPQLISFFPLLYAAFWDGTRRKIPDWTSMLIAACGFTNAALGHQTWLSAIAGGVLIGGALLGFSLSKNGIGGGDIKLCAALGVLYGLSGGLTIVVVALVLLIAVCLLWHEKALPFAPFLATAAALVQTAKIILI